VEREEQAEGADRLQEHATALADAIEVALPGWVGRCVNSRLPAGPLSPPVAAAGPGNPMRTVPSEMIFGLLRALLFLDQLRKPLTCTNA